MRNLGQGATMRCPAERLSEAKRAVEKTAWGGCRAEFLPTSDDRLAAQKERDGLPSAFKRSGPSRGAGGHGTRQSRGRGHAAHPQRA